MSDDYPEDWERRKKAVFRRDEYMCQKCFNSGERDDVVLHAHHKVPKSEGGSHDPSNLVTICGECHSNIHGYKVGIDGSDVSSGNQSSIEYEDESKSKYEARFYCIECQSEFVLADLYTVDPPTREKIQRASSISDLREHTWICYECLGDRTTH